MQRRVFCQSLFAGSLLPFNTLISAGNAKQPSIELAISASYHRDAHGLQTYLSYYHREKQQKVDIRLPFRGHGIIRHPLKKHHILVMGRRPERRFCEIDLQQQKITQIITSEPGYHYYGHGCFSPNGDFLFTSENQYDQGQGIIVVRDAIHYTVEDRFASHGIGPHDIKQLSDGKTLVVANGGILTHPDKPRKKLNIDTMRPNLSYLDSRNGNLKQRVELENHQLSMRHLAVSPQDQVVSVQQFEGERKRPVPLVISHRLGDPSPTTLKADDYTLQRMNYYTASATFDQSGKTLAVTSPKGNLVTFWDTQNGTLIKSLDMQKPYGVSLTNHNQDFLISSSTGELQRINSQTLAVEASLFLDDRRWDNHMLGYYN